MADVIAVVGLPSALGGQLPDGGHRGMADGATAMNFDRGDGARTVEAAARLAEAALGSP